MLVENVNDETDNHVNEEEPNGTEVQITKEPTFWSRP